MSSFDRKRSRKVLEEEEEKLQQQQQRQQRQQEETDPSIPSIPPLHGVIASLSGFTTDQKSELHQLIESLGGRYALATVL
jgi:hypothetical protein